MKWTVLLVVLVLHVSVARAEAEHTHTSPHTSSSAQPDAATDAADAADASAKLLEVLTPILGGSLNAELYEPGCDAAIYMCSAGTSRIQTMRFRTPAEVYAEHEDAVKSEPVLVQNTAETSDEETAAAVNDLLDEGHTVLEAVPQSGSCRARPSSDKRIAILLHGFLACSQKWHDIAQLLATEGFEVVLPLLPGHGAVDGDHVSSALHHVPADHPHIPILDRSVGYGTVAQAVADMTVAAIQQLDYTEVVLGGFSAGGAVVIDALTILATDGRLDAAALKRVRVVHVATFLETPNRVIRLARDLNPLLWINKMRMNRQWFHIERPHGHPWKSFQERGRKGLLVSSRSHEMRLLRYVTHVRKAFAKLTLKSRKADRRAAAELIADIPILGLLLLNDHTVEADHLMDTLTAHHTAAGVTLCALESNHPDSSICGTCCDEAHCAWFDAYDDRHPEEGHLLHTPDCAAVTDATVDISHPDLHTCGGSGLRDVYPDGLNHDTLLDAQSRAGKEPGWWVQCTQDLIVRYITADRSLITGQQSGKQLQCAAKPSCHGLFRMEKQTPVTTTTASSSKKKSGNKSKQVWTQVDELASAAAAPTAA
eukprot:14283-Heterococcus_DN1.PRE.2